MKQYRKLFAALSGVLIAVGEAGRDGVVDAGEGFTILTAIGVAFAVYRIPNAPAPNASAPNAPAPESK